MNSPLYNPLSDEIRRVINTIDSYGHEVGLHFDPSQYWNERPTDEELTNRVRAEQRVLGEIIDNPTEIIAFHNPPDWSLGSEFSKFSHTYEPRFFEDIGYVGDSNQRWRDQEPFRNGYPEKAQVLTHPVLWGEVDKSKNEHIMSEVRYFKNMVDTAVADAFIDKE